MTTTLYVLNHTGDLKLTWDHTDPADRDRIREEVARLKEAGYTFYLVDGSPADEIAAGAGTLVVKRLTAEELIESTPDEPVTGKGEAVVETEPNPAPEKRRRGRPPKSGVDRQAVAVRPLRGG